ncbi:signal peptidase I [Stackebrandtia nassauensis]|uniref:Signal peptidase I n=1 Tax=Stackebrandtia nassauensis (strain DSM 44728 / CIP 108903 / NRRL B-16338 / NBRC 102104 / LLR-40K-21) TaxID=446470 RepID=D3Q211_STANL|nr:signal peptidase I [Stackebrandtia nassauensis]ADD41878.1 signal peptidase I [Stackebrandtia nassauensis DSM 44728]
MSDTGRISGRASVPVSVPDSKTPATVTRSRVRRVYSHRRRHLPLWVELPLLLLVAFCAAVLLRTFVVQSFDIPSGSMENTLQIGDRVLVNKLVYNLREPQRGEVVVFKGTERWASELDQKPSDGFLAEAGRAVGNLVGIASPNEKDLIKRIIGIPGDKVKCCDAKGRVTVNGVPLNESDYVFENPPVAKYNADCQAREFPSLTVPEGHVFVMGDHRGNSKDSRCQGFVPIENFIGRAVNVVWPKSSWSALRIPDTFAKVPEPDGDPPQASTTGGGGDGSEVLPLLPMALLLRPRESLVDVVTRP